MHHAPVMMGDAEPGKEVSAGACPSLAWEAYPTSQADDAMGQLGAELCPQPAPVQTGRPWVLEEAPRLTVQAAPLGCLVYPSLLIRALVGEGLQPADRLLHRDVPSLQCPSWTRDPPLLPPNAPYCAGDPPNSYPQTAHVGPGHPPTPSPKCPVLDQGCSTPSPKCPILDQRPSTPSPHIWGISGISKRGSSVVGDAVRRRAATLLEYTEGLCSRG